MKGIASSDGKVAELSRNEIQILAILMERPGEIVTRTDMIETLWDNQIYIDDNTLSVNVTRLRTRLESLGYPDYIKTRRGLGYQI
jgi:DNA-binding response OmpR family regulator